MANVSLNPCHERPAAADSGNTRARTPPNLSFLWARRLRREADTLAEQVVVSAAATPSDDGAAAFLVMDYERVYGIGLLGADHRLDQLKVEVLPGRSAVRMGAPVWSPNGARLAYFGWDMRARMPFIDILHVGTGGIDRVWESTEYRKPGHWDLSPDGEWVWIVVSTYHADDPRTTRDLSPKYGGQRVSTRARRVHTWLR